MTATSKLPRPILRGGVIAVALVCATCAFMVPPATASAEDRRLATQRTPPQRYRPAPFRRAPRHVRPIRPRGRVYLGIGGLSSFLLEGDREITRLIRSGGGFNLFFGYRLSRFAALEVGYQATTHEVDPLGSDSERGFFQALSLDGKAFLTPGPARMQPFVQIGVGTYGFFSDGLANRKLEGFGLHAGGGVDIRLNPSVALGLRAVYKGIFVDDFEGDYFGVETGSAYFNSVHGSANLQFTF